MWVDIRCVEEFSNELIGERFIRCLCDQGTKDGDNGDASHRLHLFPSPRFFSLSLANSSFMLFLTPGEIPHKSTLHTNTNYFHQERTLCLAQRFSPPKSSSGALPGRYIRASCRSLVNQLMVMTIKVADPIRRGLPTV